MEIITGWTINFEGSNRCIHGCGAILDFPDSDFSSGIPSNVALELLVHQQMCPSMIHRISREEWEDNIQKSRIPQKDSVDKKRDDIFRQIFG